jgi:hypothetical protein
MRQSAEWAFLVTYTTTVTDDSLVLHVSELRNASVSRVGLACDVFFHCDR